MVPIVDNRWTPTYVATRHIEKIPIYVVFFYTKLKSFKIGSLPSYTLEYGVSRITVKPVLRTTHEIPPVLKDPTFPAGPTVILNQLPKTPCLERTHFYGQMGDLSRQFPLYFTVHETSRSI